MSFSGCWRVNGQAIQAQHIYSTETALQKWLWVLCMNILIYQDCEYRIRTMNIKHAQCYTFGRSGFHAPSYTQDCLSSPKYICDQVNWSGNANQLLANKPLHGGPNELRQLFSRSTCTHNKRNKWLTHSYWGIFTAKPRHGHAISPFGCTNRPPPAPPFLPRTEVTSQIVDT